MEVGQYVIICNHLGDTSGLVKIEGETKTCWRANGSLFRKRDLRLYGGDTWCRVCIREGTPEQLEAVRIAIRRKKAIAFIRRSISGDLVDKVPDETLKKIMTMLNEQSSEG